MTDVTPSCGCVFCDIDVPHKCELDRREIERLRAERNLLREMFNSAERELAAERARCARIVEAFEWNDLCGEPEHRWRAHIAAAIRKGEP